MINSSICLSKVGKLSIALKEAILIDKSDNINEACENYREYVLLIFNSGHITILIYFVVR